MHLMPRDAGDIVYDGMQVGQALSLRELRRGMQMVFQDSYASLNPRLTIEESIAFGPKVHGMSDTAARALARELLGKVGLRPEHFANRYPHEISGGQRQRVNIARALALSPRLVILDEAVSALDKSVEAQVLNLLADLKREFGLTYLFISHDLNVVRYISDRVLVMYLGEVVELGPVDAVWDAPAHPYTRALLAAMPSSDPDQRTETPPITGDPPNPIDPPPGCRFHTRCPFAEPLCANAAPQLVRDRYNGSSGGVLYGDPGVRPQPRRPHRRIEDAHEQTRRKTDQGDGRRGGHAGQRRGRRTHRQFDRTGLRGLCAGCRHLAVRPRACDVSVRASREGVAMSTEPALMTLTEVADAIAAKKVSSREVTRACLHRIAQWQPHLNAFMAIEAEEALTAADAADAALAKGDVRGPLHGVPLAHKDMYYEAGKVVTCGSLIRRDYVATTTSTALQRLKDAGTIRLGSLQMAEFAYGPTGHNSHYGRCTIPLCWTASPAARRPARAPRSPHG